MVKRKLGLALCGSYCTFDKIIPVAEILARKYDMTAIISENAAKTDTRFGCAETFVEKLREITGKEVILTIGDAEPIGPKKYFDVLAIAPCTGNTLAKIACGISDSCVSMACKSHLRNGNPVVLAISTNDALGTNAKNIGDLLNRKNVFFVPFYQDDHVNKPNSLTADLSLLPDAVEAALERRQIQPVIAGA